MGANNIWEMAAVIEADFSKSDRSIDQNARKVDQLTTKYNQLDKASHKTTGSNAALGKTFSSLQQTITGTGGPLGNMLGQFGGLISAGGRLSMSAGGVGVAIGLVAAATVGAVAGIYSLTTAMSAAVDKIGDLAQQTGFSTETLSALGNALEDSGGDINTAANSLVLFETKMVDARERGSDMSKMFKILNIDTKDHELALRQAMTALSEMTDQEMKATIGKKLFGKAAKDLLGAIAEAGSVQAYLNQQLKDGTVITTAAAKEADRLEKEQAKVQRRLRAVGISLMTEFAPAVVEALETFSTWLKDNQDELKDTAREVAKVYNDIKTLAQFLWSISPIRLEIKIIRTITNLLDFGGDDPNKPVVSRGPGGQSMFDKAWEWWNTDKPTGPPAGWGRVDMSKVKPQTPDQIKATAAGNRAAAEQERAAREAKEKAEQALQDVLNGTGGGGGRRGGGAKRDELGDQKRLLDAKLRSTLESLEGEEKGTQRSYENRRLAMARYFEAAQSFEKNRHEATMETINAEIELAKKIKEPKKRELELLDLGTEKQRELNRHNDALFKISTEIKGVTRERIVLTDTLISRLQREREVLKEIRQERSRFKSEVERDDLGGGSFVLTPEERERINRSGRVVTPEEQVKRDQLEIFRDKMRAMAADLTFMIDDSMRVGFERGIKHGIAAFGLGLLEMARHAAFKELEKVFANLLGGKGTASDDGGGWLSTAIKFGINAIAGLFGGASVGGAGSAAAGAIGGKAEGGFIRPFEWSWVGEKGREKVRAGYQGVTVLSNEESTRGSGGNVYNVTIPIHVPSVGAAGTRETQFQVRRALADTVKAATLRG